MNRKSSWGHRLRGSRVVIRPRGLLDDLDIRLTDLRALGILVRLLPYIATNSLGDGDPRALASRAMVSLRVFRRHWPELERFFERDANGELHLRQLSWLRVQAVSAGRSSLKYLFDQLLTFWGTACVYCGTESDDLQIEHIVPVVRGGSDHITNLTLACASCNSKKRTQTAAEFGFPQIHEMAERIQ